MNDVSTNSLDDLTNNNLLGSAAPSANPIDMFSTTFSTTGMPGDETFNHGFLMGNDWDYTQSTGMTPMSDGSWNQMLESVTMGWDAGVPPHPHRHGEEH
jgi:hypothetical protein